MRVLGRRAAAAVAALAAVVALPIDSVAEPAPASVVGVVDPHKPAEPVAQAPSPAGGPEPELTAADVAVAPIPGYESGRADPPEGDSTWRGVGRGLLFVPRLAIDAALTPLRTALWANERYHLTDWYRRIFFNDEQTIGLYPTGSIDTSLGVTVGARFVDRDLLGAHEQLGIGVEIGSRYRQIYDATLSSGQRLGERFVLGLSARYELRPHDAFYGIGNGDRGDRAAMPGEAGVDPRVDATAIEAHYRQDRARLVATADLRAVRALHVRAAGTISQVGFGAPDDGESITMAYDPRGLVGFGGYRYGYGELELRWDDRHGAGAMEPPSVLSAGQLAAVFAGRFHRLDDGRDFWRYGADLEKFVRIAQGPRAIAIHLHGEAVTGSRDEVPFNELPRLGGPSYLRGYALDQFRDRVAAFGSLAYVWDLSQWFSASVFTDVGRVYPALSELASDRVLDHLRMGYGVSIEGHSVESFVVEGSLGSSIDGGLFLNLSFHPVYDIDQRVTRR